jgi:flagellar biosynthesis/type III secretory pathway protein FliH
VRPDSAKERREAAEYTAGYRDGHCQGYQDGLTDGRQQGYLDAKWRAHRALGGRGGRAKKAVEFFLGPDE